MIRGSHFGWSFHNRVSVLFDYVPSEEGGSVEIDFAFQNGKLRTVRSEGIQWKTGGILSLEFVSVVLYFVIFSKLEGRRYVGSGWNKGKESDCT